MGSWGPGRSQRTASQDCRRYPASPSARAAQSFVEREPAQKGCAKRRLRSGAQHRAGVQRRGVHEKITVVPRLLARPHPV
jgi:hypothetical protein